MILKEKKHRLPKEFYKGKVSIAFTLTLKKNIKFFVSSDVVSVFSKFLKTVAADHACVVPVYCYMPDHQHLIMSGETDESDLWRAIVSYKQKTGFWMAKHHSESLWQKDFYDHIIRKRESLATHVRYILDNPVRKGLVSSWEEYTLKGSIGCDLEDIVYGIM